MSDNIPYKFKALRIFDDEHGYRSELVEQSIGEQSEGDVVIQVAWSGVNYKDALAATGNGKILREFPLNGGIDAAGTVVQSDNAGFSEGNEVLITGCGLSETRDRSTAATATTFGSLPSGWYTGPMA